MQFKKRIEYLDAMRGLTMILVVYSHVHLFSFHLFNYLGGGNSYNDLFIMIRMPLFFFVSGFLVEKPGVVWKLQDVIPFIKQKAKIQLIPTFVFMLLFCYLFDINVINCLGDVGKCGYWFTITLFQYFLAYSLCKMVPARFQYKALFVMTLLFFGMIRFPGWDAFQFVKLWYFVFFSFGAYAKSHFSSFVDFLKGKYFPVLLVAFFLIAFIKIKGSFLDVTPIRVLENVFLGMAGICIVFNFFRKHEESFRQTTVLGRALQYIGKRTLDVYLLHYFFLPRHLELVGDFFRDNYNPSVEFVCSFLVSIVVVGLSLVMSNVIRTSDTLAHWLFGVKKDISRTA